MNTIDRLGKRILKFSDDFLDALFGLVGIDLGPLAPPDPNVEDCPMCVHLSRWFGEQPVRKVSHGASSEGREWRSCYEHYRAISAFEWLNWTGVYRDKAVAE